MQFLLSLHLPLTLTLAQVGEVKNWNQVIIILIMLGATTKPTIIPSTPPSSSGKWREVEL